jgi:allophanate hydrolase subunit 2
VTVELPFVVGGQWDDHAPDARQAFLATTWSVSHEADRVGIRLHGPPLPGGGRSVAFASDGTVTGAIQVAGDGRPILLLVDRQTTGGYPKLGAVASVALSLIGQLSPGDTVRFVPMTVAEAQASLRS